MDLIPCPFCGNDRLELWQHPAYGQYRVVCDFSLMPDSAPSHCGMLGPVADTPEKAKEAWSRRVGAYA